MNGIGYWISFTELGKASVNGIIYTGGVAETLKGEGWSTFNKDDRKSNKKYTFVLIKNYRW